MERKSITVQGIVQGVGFRPFVYHLALRLGLDGFVKNRAGCVLIEAEGDRATLHRFLDELESQAPPLSRIDKVESQPLPVRSERGFRIEYSDRETPGQIFISPDFATCPDCLAELFDPADRRFQYPFLNCTNCGPRLTIITGAPYDRRSTTMANFAMCSACQAEYDDPADRRFHAQPIACPACGPRLAVLTPDGQSISTDQPLRFFVQRILEGGIGALKGLGGFHLVCDARNDQTVGELRRRKQRDEKPFAIMVRDIDHACELCEINDDERALLESRQRPIVLLRKRRDETSHAYRLAEGLAPGNPCLGVMLPYTPLHHLLMKAVSDTPLVMTSGNRADEPSAYLDDDAIERLSDIADVLLTHNRPIHVRCDDSVSRCVDGVELPLRRSRGYAPQPIKLPFECPYPIIAVGGQLKNVFALGHGQQAFLSQHLGDLDHFAAYRAFERDINLYEQLFNVQPKLIAHDLHPDYASTAFARRRADNHGHKLFGVQHHHAHMASCMAEHGLDEPVIGVSFDGTGYGTDHAIWGGEFLVGDYSQFTRAAHFRNVRLPGGDAAIREPWRIAISQLLDAGCADFSLKGVSSHQRRTIEQMVQRGFHSPFTSSVGRLFDAVAAIAGVRTEVAYEGQAAMQMEWLATDTAKDGTYPFELMPEQTVPIRWNAFCNVPPPQVLPEFELTSDAIDTRPLIRAVVRDVRQHVSVDLIARRFHSTLTEIIVKVCHRIRTETQLQTVVLSGGVFLNAILTRDVCAELKFDGFRVFRHRLVPPGDGGLSLGQLAVAAKVAGLSRAGG
ncbi:MAG: hypF [Planctomycetaceae bacterium]|nr:hypF [Planctomycetaceae bacterium]